MFHHLMQSDLNSPPEMTTARMTKVNTSSTVGVGPVLKRSVAAVGVEIVVF